MPRFAFTLALSLALTLSLRADWPEFRGPSGQGLSEAKNPPTEWAPDKNVTWVVPIPGKGWSSPVVSGGRIFLTTAVPDGTAKDANQSLQAVCIDAATGKVLWAKEVFQQDGKSAPKIHSKNSHASPTPAVDGDRVYVHFGHMGIACLRTTDGSTVWTNRELEYKPVHGNGGSPVVYKDRVFVCIDGPGRRELVAFDKMSGKVLWEAKRAQPAKREFSFSTPLVITVDGQAMVVAPGSDVINGVDPETGNELWAFPYDGYSVVPRPVFAHGLIIFSTGYDRPTLYAIKVEKQGGKFAAKEAWSTKSNAPHNPSPLVVGDELYTVSDAGIANCYDAKTGKVYWSERIQGPFSSSPIYAAGKVYMQNETGTGIVLKASTTFDPIATNKLTERSLASYGMDGDSLLIRTESNLYRIK